MVAVLFYYLCFVKKSFRHILPFLAMAFLPVSLKAQTDLVFKLETVGATGGGQHAPFWHTSNRQGLPSVESSNGYAHIAALGGVHRPSGFGVDYGVDLGGGAGLESNLFVHQLYADVNYGTLLSGRRFDAWCDGFTDYRLAHLCLKAIEGRPDQAELSAQLHTLFDSTSQGSIADMENARTKLLQFYDKYVLQKAK